MMGMSCTAANIGNVLGLLFAVPDLRRYSTYQHLTVPKTRNPQQTQLSFLHRIITMVSLTLRETTVVYEPRC